LEAFERNHQTPFIFLQKHFSGDWGELCEEDRLLNDQALVDGSRILSAYRLKDNTKIWIITEAADEQGRREATTTLLPSDY
jgi:lipocalin